MNDDIIRLKEREREGKRDKENNNKKKENIIQRKVILRVNRVERKMSLESDRRNFFRKILFKIHSNFVTFTFLFFFFFFIIIIISRERYFNFFFQIKRKTLTV